MRAFPSSGCHRFRVNGWRHFSSHRQSSTGCVAVTATCVTSQLSQITSKTQIYKMVEQAAIDDRQEHEERSMLKNLLQQLQKERKEEESR